MGFELVQGGQNRSRTGPVAKAVGTDASDDQHSDSWGVSRRAAAGTSNSRSS